MKCIGWLIVRGSPGQGDYLIMMQLNRSHLQFTKSIISIRKHLLISSSSFQVRGRAISCHWRMWPSSLSPSLGYPGQKLRGRVSWSQIWHQLRGFCSKQQIHCVGKISLLVRPSTDYRTTDLLHYFIAENNIHKLRGFCSKQQIHCVGKSPCPS